MADEVSYLTRTTLNLRVKDARCVISFMNHPLLLRSAFSGRGGRYVASFAMVVILQGVWDEGRENEEREAAAQREDGFPSKFNRSCLSCFAVLSLTAALQFVAPRLGEFLLSQLDDVRLLRRGSSGDRRCERWGWKTAKECLATSVVFGLCMTAAVVSGAFDAEVISHLYTHQAEQTLQAF